MNNASPADIRDLVVSAGGQLVGRTRLQKAAFLLECMGLGYGFSFAYHHYGPYSEDVALAAEDAVALALVEEERRAAAWGGSYSIYRANASSRSGDAARRKALTVIANAPAIPLELAATAVFLADEGTSQPWEEVVVRKSSKATPENLAQAKAVYEQLQGIAAPRALPRI